MARLMAFRRLMTLQRLIRGLLILFVVLLLAGGWYANVAWEAWKQASSIHNFNWQGVELSLAGVQLERLSVTQMRNGQPYLAEASALSLGWSWHWWGPMPDVVRVGRLAVNIPVWPVAGEQETPSAAGPGALSRQLPAWLPDTIRIDQLVLTLPEGIRAEGDLAVSQLSSPDDREIVTNAMTVEAPIPGMTRGGWRLHEGRLSLVFAAKADQQSATLDFGDQSQIELSRVDAPDSAAQLDTLRIDLAGTTLKAGYSLQPMALEKLAFTGPVIATTAAIHQPQLHTQPWRLDGKLDGNLQSIRFDGELSSDAGTNAKLGLSFPFDGTPTMNAEMTTVGASGGRALADTFKAWPKALEIGEGSARTTLELRFPSAGAELQGAMAFDGLGGLFGRTAWAGLAGTVTMDLAGNEVGFGTTGLALDTVNPGVAVNTVQLAGRYRATTEQLAAGTLMLNLASAKLLGGDLRIESGEWQLSQRPLRIPVQLSGIELSQLMQVYPAEGLSGSGILRGTVPLRISGQSISVESGQIDALAPGGTLKLPAEKLRGMAQGNEAMALVVRAMQNFNFSVLNSTVNYDQDGKLILGLRLEGSSPDVRDGHPIVLNINLEEDIPALMTSLQLSGRVNEAVTEKVRNLMQKRGAERQSTGSDH